MIDSLLHARLQPVIERRERAALWRRLALVWIIAALAAWTVVWLQSNGVAPPRFLSAWLALAALAASAACWLHARLARPDLRRLANQLESRHRDLDGRLITAVQQEPDKKGNYTFLQERLFEDSVRHSVDHDWESVAPAWHLQASRVVAGAALAACLAGLVGVRTPPASPALASLTGGETTPDGVTVTPGDVSLERGSSLTVMARFEHAMPASADLVIGASAVSERRILLVRSLADPVFGGTVPDVAEGFAYRIDYGGRRTRDFQVTVYEHPRLERSDAELSPPAYTGLPTQRIEDTRRVSAVEGTRLALNLQLNKPVASAVLVPKEKSAAPVPLAVAIDRAVATLADFSLTASQSYELKLVDADGRANKVPDLFVLEALPNRPPELKLTSPRGDVRPSALEEVAFEGTAWDDFGVLAYGIGLSRGGEAPELLELGKDVPAREKAAFQHMLQLEARSAKEDDLFSWFVWADDIGPDGQRRRTQGDMFFAEVRPFEEIFREGAGMGGEQQGGQQGGPATRLAELQKQVINATWKLRRSEPPGESYPADTAVVRDAQKEALDLAQEAAAAVEEPMRVALWESVIAKMEQSLEKLKEAPTVPAVLPDALLAGQAAYQGLLQLRERETGVNRSQSQQGQASAGEQQRQDQLDELDLEQSENRYETERQAQAQQSADRRAQMQVQNRMQELARRQEDINEQLKELQAALQTAEDEQKREELRRQLKRLEEEQRQMLADMDETRQRMERPEVQSQMSQQREKLEQTRQDAQRAAEAASQGDVPQALAAGTRAERQLEEMRDQLRRETAGQLAEELRQMRAEARDLARQQEAVSNALASDDQPRQQSLSETPEEEKPLEKLESQRERTAALVERASQLSDESEESEPLVSRQLYDSLRQFSQTDATSVKQAREEIIRDGMMTQDLYRQLQQLQDNPQPGQALSLTSELVRAELEEQAQQAAGQAQAGLDQLRTGVERAAERVLGDDTAALQAADRELQALADELAQEAAAAQGGQPAAAPSDRSDMSAPSDPSDPSDARTAQAGGQPGEAPQDGEGQDGQGREGQSASRQQAQAAGEGGGEGQRGRTAESTSGGPGGGGGPEDQAERIANLLDGGGAFNGGRGGGAPIEGDGFTNWSDRLREVEEMLDFPDLRNSVASARERARVLRLEAKRDLKKPDWAVVDLEILRPLVEVRQQVRDELRRRSADDLLAPIDRDPVPERFADLVRRYYEELGRDK
ncbi:MAG: hypothetical protein ACKV19_13370 [Verrucomicrobiales bacterium]